MVKLFLKNSNLCDHNSLTSQTDRQTTCDRNTALCTKVHRALKIGYIRLYLIQTNYVNNWSTCILISTESQLWFVMSISSVLLWWFVVYLSRNQTFLDTFKRRRCLLLIPDGGLWGQRGDQSVEYHTTTASSATDHSQWLNDLPAALHNIQYTRFVATLKLCCSQHRKAVAHLSLLAISYN